MKLPHFHIMNSEYGDCLERGIKTWEEACRQLRREAWLQKGKEWKVTGKAADGAYYFHRAYDYVKGQDDGSYAEYIISIYTCTGEQPCPCEGELV